MKRRYPHTRTGGNWQGIPYFSYAEHDQCTRATFGLGTKERRREAYRREADKILAKRT